MSTGARRKPATADVSREAADDALRAARVRRMGWGLGLLMIACYLGFIALTALEGPL
jgi:hypothetical protein